MEFRSPLALLPYQLEVIQNPSRFIVLEWARGTRKTFTATLKIVLDVLMAEAQGTFIQWIILSRGERQSVEALRHCTRHWKALRYANPSYRKSVFVSGRQSREYKQLELSFPGGSQIIALPANEDTARGYTANVFLDEYSIHPNDHEIWNAIYPSLRGRCKMIVASTPKGGRSRKFYELVSGQIPDWSHSRVDIYDAIRAGLPFDLERERRAMNSATGWAQEMELLWVNDDEAWLDFDLVMACVQDDPVLAGGQMYMGVDVGRSRDLTVLWLVERLGDRIQTVEVKALEKAPFLDQEREIVRFLEEWKVVRCCVDATGLGVDLAERLRRSLGYRIEPVTFTMDTKAAMAHAVRERMEARSLTVFSDPVQVSSLQSLRRISTESGRFRFDASAKVNGHADYFWALALAVRAAGQEAIPSIVRIPHLGARRRA